MKLKNAESQIFGLECKLKELQKPKSVRETAANDGDVEKLTKEIQSMDRIIESLNQENAKLLKQIKEQKIDLRQSQVLMYTENQKVSNNLTETQHQLTEMQETKIEELQPAAFNEIQKLRKQLQEIKNTSVRRERELGLQISKIKEENRELQFKMNGIDKQRFDDESDIIQQCKREATKMQKKYQNEINELQRKLKWYIENQELIENLNDKIKKQHSEIFALRTHSTSPSPKTLKRSHAKPSKQEHRQIVVLKKKVCDLEKALASKHPDSIANLISLMGSNDDGDDGQSNIIVQQLREQICSLQEVVDNKEDETLSRLRALRQQHDKVQLQLKRKVNSLQQQITKSKREKGFIRPSAKIKELEKQMEDLKQSHAKKIKLLRDKHINQIRKEQQEKVGGSGSVIISNPNNYNKQIIDLQNDLGSKINEIDTLNGKLKQKMAMIDNLQMTIDTKEQSHADLKTQISLLQIQLTNAVRQQQESVQHPPNNSEQTNQPKSVTGQQAIKMNQDSNADFAEKEKMYNEKIKMMDDEINEYKRECAILSERVDLERSKGEQSVKAMQNQLEWNKLEKEKTEQLIAKLQFEINHTKNTPSFVEYQALLLKLERIEQRGGQREKQLEETYMKLLQSNDDIEETLTNKYEGIIQTKNAEISTLKNELSVLMTAFDKIQS